MLTRSSRVKLRHYIIQSFFASFAVFTILSVLTLKQAVLVASLGASAFVVFAMPKSVTANPRNIVGGYIAGILSGAVFSLLGTDIFGLPSISYSLAVGLSIFIMTVTDTEHPPASGAALAVAVKGISFEVIAIVLAGAGVLAFIHYKCKGYLKNLV